MRITLATCQMFRLCRPSDAASLTLWPNSRRRDEEREPPSAPQRHVAGRESVLSHASMSGATIDRPHPRGSETLLLKQSNRIHATPLTGEAKQVGHSTGGRAWFTGYEPRLLLFTRNAVQLRATTTHPSRKIYLPVSGRTITRDITGQQYIIIMKQKCDICAWTL